MLTSLALLAVLSASPAEPAPAVGASSVDAVKPSAAIVWARLAHDQPAEVHPGDSIRLIVRARRYGCEPSKSRPSILIDGGECTTGAKWLLSCEDKAVTYRATIQAKNFDGPCYVKAKLFDDGVETARIMVVVTP